MGRYADDIIDGLCDAQGDYTYKYNKKSNSKYVKDTPAEANIRAVRRELAILIKKKQAKNDPQPVENARKEINQKYGKGWRSRGLIVNDKNQW